MNSIHRILRNGVAIESFDFTRATINDAEEIKDNLLDDINFNKIIVDLSNCNYIDSTFLRALIFAHRILKHQNCTMVLVISETFLSRSFIYKEISSIFRVYHSISEAVDALNTNCEQVANYNSISRKETVKIVQMPVQLNVE